MHHLTAFAMIVKISIRILWGGVIPYQINIGKGTQITYQGLGVVLSKYCTIGENCIIRQGVTIALGDDPRGAAQIGNNVIWGNIKIGDNVRIGANSFVNKDIPSNCTAVGAPAKPVKFRQ